MSAKVLAINLRFIQAGGYGNVFRADRSDNGGAVAVKYLREHRDPHARKAFSQQVRILARKIPGMVSLLDGTPRQSSRGTSWNILNTALLANLPVGLMTINFTKLRSNSRNTFPASIMP